MKKHLFLILYTYDNLCENNIYKPLIVINALHSINIYLIDLNRIEYRFKHPFIKKLYMANRYIAKALFAI